MGASESMEVVLEAFRAVERRDDERLQELYHPEVEFHWPPSFTQASEGSNWSDVWEPFQPTEAERQLDPRVVAASDDEVVVLWRQRAVSPSGEHFDGEALGLYQVRDGKFARAQMFYFDMVAVVDFLARARRRLATGGQGRGHPGRPGLRSDVRCWGGGM
jgi:ketosteroid isomerase-like protein